jgi:hypothetical protein
VILHLVPLPFVGAKDMNLMGGCDGLIVALIGKRACPQKSFSTDCADERRFFGKIFAAQRALRMRREKIVAGLKSGG